MDNLDRLRLEIAKFAADRDWDKFHSPKNLTMALSVEVAELAELLQWLTEEQSRNPSDDLREALSQEIADSAIYLIQLADKLDISLISAIDKKIEINKKKYQAGKVKGSSEKYTAYDQDDSSGSPIQRRANNLVKMSCQTR